MSSEDRGTGAGVSVAMVSSTGSLGTFIGPSEVSGATLAPVTSGLTVLGGSVTASTCSGGLWCLLGADLSDNDSGLKIELSSGKRKARRFIGYTPVILKPVMMLFIVILANHAFEKTDEKSYRVTTLPGCLTMDFDSTSRVPYIHTRVRTKLSVQREGRGAKA